MFSNHSNTPARGAPSRHVFSSDPRRMRDPGENVPLASRCPWAVDQLPAHPPETRPGARTTWKGRPDGKHVDQHDTSGHSPGVASIGSAPPQQRKARGRGVVPEGWEGLHAHAPPASGYVPGTQQAAADPAQDAAVGQPASSGPGPHRRPDRSGVSISRFTGEGKASMDEEMRGKKRIEQEYTHEKEVVRKGAGERPFDNLTTANHSCSLGGGPETDSPTQRGRGVCRPRQLNSAVEMAQGGGTNRMNGFRRSLSNDRGMGSASAPFATTNQEDHWSTARSRSRSQEPLNERLHQPFVNTGKKGVEAFGTTTAVPGLSDKSRSTAPYDTNDTSPQRDVRNDHTTRWQAGGRVDGLNKGRYVPSTRVFSQHTVGPSGTRDRLWGTESWGADYQSTTDRRQQCGPTSVSRTCSRDSQQA